jgi:STE24 endopeptidase
MGRARRILLSDTLLENFSDAEIEVVLAHEMGHHVRRDIRRAMLLETALITAALGAGAALLAAAWRPLGLAGPADVAGLPLVVIGALTVSCVSRPVLNAVWRRFERRADRFALALTNQPAAFISTMRRFAAKNLAEERPSRATLWMFHTHPSFTERIRLAEEFEWCSRSGADGARGD